ncbi:MAG: FtsX-like permease family protein [Thermofilaceae archaeon]
MNLRVSGREKKSILSETLVPAALMLLLTATPILNPLTAAQPTLTPTPHGFEKIIVHFNKSLFIEDVQALSKSSRFTGYPGFFEAANYIADVFKGAGIAPLGKDYFEWFEVTVPITGDSWISVEDGLKVAVYPLYPNLVNPSPYRSDDWDYLVYVGKGELEDFNGKNVSGKFVLMNFACGWNYYYALMLGAKGVVFVPESSDAVTRPEADQKLTLVPVYFPKLYMPLEREGIQLLELAKKAGDTGIKVKIFSQMRWDSVKVPNVVGFIKGKNPAKSNKVVVIASYYDSYSVVPSLSFGAEDALGIATLLQFARFLAENPPEYSVALVALAGHYQALWGAREFVERRFDDGREYVAFASIDLSSESDQVGIYVLGSAYSYRYADILVRRYTWLVSRAFGPWLAEIRMLLGSKFGENFVDGVLASYPGYIRSVPMYEPYRYGFLPSSAVFPSHNWYLASQVYLFDSEPFTLAMYGGGFTFRTTNAFKTRRWTPADRLDYVNFENVWPQAYFIHCILWAMLNEDINLPTSKERLRDDWGYVTLRVKVTTYNMLTSYWDTINFTEKPELKGKLIAYVTSGGLRIAQKVSDDGTVTIHGLKPYAGGGVDIFAIEDNGKITWTTDVGVWQAPGWKGIPLTTHPHEKLIAIFECASIFIPFVFQPTDFRTLSLTSINDARAHSPMIRQNSLQTDMFAMAFVQPGVPAEVTFTIGTGLPSIVLNNASPAKPEGFGYTLNKGEQIVLTPLDAFKNLYTIVDNRYNNIKSRNVIIPTIEFYANATLKLKSEFEKMLEERNYSKAFGACLFAWAALINWYNTVMSAIGQVITSIAVFFLISLLFALLFERLAFKAEGSRRLFTLLLILVVANAVLYTLHPAYHIATNWTIVLLTVTFLAFNIIMLYIAIMNAYSAAKIIRESRVGKHFVEVSRSGLMVESMTLAIENIKKRKLRTILILVATTAITFAMISLASVTSSPVMLPQGVNTTRMPDFEGLLIRAYPWDQLNFLTYEMYNNYLEGKCYIAPRAFLYPPPLLVAMPGVTTGLLYLGFSPQLKTQIYGMLVLSPNEVNVSGLDRLIVRGRWFSEGDVYAVILTESVSSSLSQELGRPIDAGSTIKLWGLELRVVGIISDRVANFTNPDGEPVTPIDPQSPVATPLHLSARNIMVIPYSLYRLIAVPPTVTNIAVKPLNERQLIELKGLLPSIVSYPIYLHWGGELRAWVMRQWVSAIGFEFIIIPAILAAASILDLMLASVYERRRELYVFTAVGMAPSHVTTVFLTEALTYVVPAVFFGYVTGILATNAMLAVGAFPSGLYPNFTSLAILVVVGLCTLLVVVAAYYPSTLASRLAIPSHVRRWLSAEKGPAGDEWRITYPLILSSAGEVYGFMNFLSEYMRALELRESAFFAEKIEISEEEKGGDHVIRLHAHCRFAPYDLGIRSDILITAIRKKDASNYVFDALIKRVEGYWQAWRGTALTVAGDLRKEIIAWRALSPEERKKYTPR